MGKWTVVVEGDGQHHNGAENDSDELLRAFVKTLKESGHTVEHVSFTSINRETMR